MKNLALAFISAIFIYGCNSHNESFMKGKIAIAVHGGSGNIKDRHLTTEMEKQYQEVLSAALDSGYIILTKGGSSVDAVQKAVTVMEDSPLFNAGKGSVFTNAGENEMDAAIMNGANMQSGAVACVKTIKNPVAAARLVMDSSKFAFLSGNGAESFAAEKGIEIVDPSYFFTQERWDQLQKVKDSDSTHLDHDEKDSHHRGMEGKKYGTVGCVALDEKGNLAAATSTGGIVNKKYNRIGDSPVIGAGTYADSACAISCTGRGEQFIRLVTAHDIAAIMEYKKITLSDAVKEAFKKLKTLHGRGGCIAIDKAANVCTYFTTTGMFRGYIDSAGEKHISIY